MGGWTEEGLNKDWKRWALCMYDRTEAGNILISLTICVLWLLCNIITWATRKNISSILHAVNPHIEPRAKRHYDINLIYKHHLEFKLQTKSRSVKVRECVKNSLTFEVIANVITCYQIRWSIILLILCLFYNIACGSSSVNLWRWAIQSRGCMWFESSTTIVVCKPLGSQVLHPAHTEIYPF